MSSINNEQLLELVSNAQMALVNEQYHEAFNIAKEAIKLNDKCADAYQFATNVCMSLNRYEDAIEYYQEAVDCDPDNGSGDTLQHESYPDSGWAASVSRLNKSPLWR